jgi:hypothetical protein
MIERAIFSYGHSQYQGGFINGNTDFEVGVSEIPAPINNSASKTVINELVVMTNEAHYKRTLCLGGDRRGAQENIIYSRADAMLS